ncbi:MAG: hypothetical protein U9R38_08350 [Candidatus Margulisiibacteriota bacterium]|nr:hypothetical protein [Candidatus Margulisiibacteriota bacterium]
MLISKGVYSAGNVSRVILNGRSMLVKRMPVPDIMERALLECELKRRRRDLAVYYERLRDAEVNVPHTYIKLSPRGEFFPESHGLDRQILLISDEIPALNAFLAVQRTDYDMVTNIILTCFEETLKIARTVESCRPIGADLWLANFVVHENRAWLVDIYPPRLGFRYASGGCPVRLSEHELLINYPEGPELGYEKIARLRGSYYSIQGMIVHFTSCALSAYYSKFDPGLVWDDVRSSDDTGNLVNVILTRLEKSELAKLLGSLSSYFRSRAFYDYMVYRFNVAHRRAGEIMEV